MKKFFVLVFLVVLCSCSSDDSPLCDDVTNQAWFVNLTDELDQNCSVEKSIFKGRYNNEIVYYELITDPRVNFQAILEFYDCEGNLVAELTAEESNQYLNERRSSDEKIYTCSE